MVIDKHLDLTEVNRSLEVTWRQNEELKKALKES